MRDRGTFNFSGNLEVKKDAPLEARSLVNSYADLVKPETWTDEQGGIWKYDCMLVSCKDRPGKVYQLSPGADYTKESSWILIGDTSELNSKVQQFINSKGAPNGLASLNESGIIPSAQLPSYVDDVIEVDTFSNLPGTGESGKIYIVQDTNLTYRWSGTDYVEISKSLALGETSSTAYSGDKGKATTDKLNRIPDKLITDTVNVNQSTTEAVLNFTTYRQEAQQVGRNTLTITSATISQAGLMSSSDKTKLDGLKDQAGITSDIDAVQTNLETHINNKTNPHEVTKAQVGLGNVDNTSDANKPISTATQTALNSKFSATDGNALKQTIENMPNLVVTEGSVSHKNNNISLSLRQQDLKDPVNTDSILLTFNPATDSTAGIILPSDKSKIDKIITNGNGTRYLADDGTYKLIQGGGSGDSGGGTGGGIEEAPTDSKVYGRKNANWSEITVDDVTVKIPVAVSSLTTNATSDDIIRAFGSKEDMAQIAEDLSAYKLVAFVRNTDDRIVIMYIPHFMSQYTDADKFTMTLEYEMNEIHRTQIISMSGGSASIQVIEVPQADTSVFLFKPSLTSDTNKITQQNYNDLQAAIQANKVIMAPFGFMNSTVDGNYVPVNAYLKSDAIALEYVADNTHSYINIASDLTVSFVNDDLAFEDTTVKFIDSIGTVDLNTVTNGTGVHEAVIAVQTFNGNATLDKNYPVEEAGSLISIGTINGRTNQIYHTFDENRLFIRGAGVSSYTNWEEIAKKTDIPTNVSQLTNDSNYATKSELPTVPTNVSAFTNDADYTTSEDIDTILSNSRSVGYMMQLTEIDASGLDENTWYPVVMSLGNRNTVRIEVIVGLDSGTKPSWSTHDRGFSVRKIWEVNGLGWGTSPVINHQVFVSDYVFADTDPVRGFGQLSYTSEEYVFVRGGGKYFFYTSHGVIPVLKTETYEGADGQSISPTTETPAEIVANMATKEYVDEKISNIFDLEGFNFKTATQSKKEEFIKWIKGTNQVARIIHDEAQPIDDLYIPVSNYKHSDYGSGESITLNFIAIDCSNLNINALIYISVYNSDTGVIDLNSTVTIDIKRYNITPDYIKRTIITSDNLTTITKKSSGEYEALTKDDKTMYAVTD